MLRQFSFGKGWGRGHLPLPPHVTGFGSRAWLGPSHQIPNCFPDEGVHLPSPYLPTSPRMGGWWDPSTPASPRMGVCPADVKLYCSFTSFKPEFIIVIFIHYKPRIAFAIFDLQWMQMILCDLKIEENYHVLVNQFHGNNHSKTLGCKEINSVFRDVKWCFNASWGLKGLTLFLRGNRP